MNNFQYLASNEDNPILPPKKDLKTRESEVRKILEALRTIIHSTEWSSLKETIFDKEQAKLNKELLDDSLSENPNPQKLRFLAGRLFQMKRNDLEKLEAMFHAELTGIRQMLHGKEE